MSMRSRLLVGTVGLLLVSGCASPSPLENTPTTTPSAITPTATDDPTPSMEVADGATPDRSKSFSAVVPRGWASVPSSNPSMLMLLRAPKAVENLYPSISVTSSDAPSGVELDTLADDVETQQRQRGYSVTPGTARTVGGVPATGYLLERKAKQKNKDGVETEVDVRQTQILVLHENKLFAITGTASPKAKPDLEGAMASMLSTWAWTADGATAPMPAPARPTPQSTSASPPKPSGRASKPGATSTRTPAPTPSSTKKAGAEPSPATKSSTSAPAR